MLLLQIHSNTLDLAAVSPFFYKLLSSGKVERMTSMVSCYKLQEVQTCTTLLQGSRLAADRPLEVVCRSERLRH